MILNCPLPLALTPIAAQLCAFKFDQIVRLAFQRRQPNSAPPFETLADIQNIENWDALKIAAGNTKVTLSPIFTGLVIPQSEALITGGGDNSTFRGIREYNGENAITVTGQFKNLAPAIKRQLDLYSQESIASATGVSNLTIYMINHNGNIFPRNPVGAGEVATTQYFGVPVYNFRISSPGSEGFNAPNINGFSFDLDANWADYITAIAPAFDPLTDL